MSQQFQKSTAATADADADGKGFQQAQNAFADLVLDTQVSDPPPPLPPSQCVSNSFKPPQPFSMYPPRHMVMTLTSSKNVLLQVTDSLHTPHSHSPGELRARVDLRRGGQNDRCVLSPVHPNVAQIPGRACVEGGF